MEDEAEEDLLVKMTKNACSSWAGKMAKVIIMMVTRHEYIVGIYFSIILLRGEFTLCIIFT